MYTLRTVMPDGTQINEALGAAYTVIGKQENYERFIETYKHQTGEDFPNKYVGLWADNPAAHCIAFIYSQGARSIHTIDDRHKSYIMTEGGKTFDRLYN